MIGTQPPKTITTRTGNKCQVKEDLVIEDITECIKLHIWQDMFDTLTNGKAYSLDNLYLQSFQGELFLSCSQKTTSTEVDTEEELSSLAKNILEEEISVIKFTQFEAVRNVEKFIQCKNYREKIALPIKNKIIKCQKCKCVFRFDEDFISAMAEVQFVDGGHLAWANIHRDIMKGVLNNSLSSASEADMGQAIILLEDFTIEFKRTTNLVLHINADIFVDSMA